MDANRGSAPLAKAVTAAKPRLRLGFAVALLMTMAGALMALLVQRSAGPQRLIVDTAAGVHCTPLDAELRIRDPNMTENDRITCLAIAGKIDEARTRMIALPSDGREAALQRV